MQYSKPMMDSDDFDRGDMMRRYKKFLKEQEARIYLRHRSTNEGLRICQERTELVDHIIRCLATDLPKVMDPPLKGPLPMSLIATGGYARGVMNRHSDVDLSFIFPGNKFDPKPEEAAFVGEFLQIMGDLGFAMGHGTDCVGGRIRFANEDPLTKTAYVTMRFIAGDPQAYTQMQARFVRECIAGKEDDFLKVRMDEMKKRHAQHENTPFVQQPNVKEGCGALRDYQNLVWVSFAKLRITDLSELVERGLLDRRGWNELKRAYDYLLRVRNEMHYLERREQDVLGMKLQGPVATRLGYKGKTMIERIEHFMHDYYTHARNILRQSSKVLDSFNLLMLNAGENKSLMGKLMSRLSGGKKAAKIERFDGFYAQHGRIFAEEDPTFAKEPERLMRLFMHTQQRNLRLAPELFDTVCNTARVNKEFQYSKAVRETFMSLLEKKGDVARVLRQMHRCDFLGRYIPEFGALTLRIQHELFHHYAADEHTLRCIDYLDELAGEDEKGLEFYQTLFRQMLDPAVLYLALIMHDTGRAANKKTHADESTMLADKVCRRLQIKGERRNQLLFLVDNHLLMFITATKKDPDDPEVVAEFARIVKNRENLDALLLMTMADSKGVGGNNWSGFKEIAMRELYGNTLRYLAAPADFMARATVSLDGLKAEVLGQLGKSYAKEVDEHFERMPRAYFNFRKPTTIANHLRQFREFHEAVAKAEDPGSVLPVMRWDDRPAEGCSKLVVIGWDRHLLLARVAGALAAEQLSIISADFYQRSDGLVLDVFRVSTTNFEPVSGENTRKRVQKAVHETMASDDFDFKPRITARRRPAGMAEMDEWIEQFVIINNHSSPNHTVVELQAIDRVGLLYDVFMVIGHHHFSVTHARIGTERGVAVDAIYVQDSKGRKITDPGQFMPLKHALLEAVIQKKPG